jgi:hypothetical protein
MAMIKCPECGKDVSSRAPSCPNCGNPINLKSGPEKVSSEGASISTVNAYVHKDSGTLGPYSQEELQAELQAGTFTVSDKACLEGATSWTTAGVLLGLAQDRLCPQCHGVLALQVESPDKGTGIIVIVLGILLAPFCVGIFLIIWGLTLTSNIKYHYHCRGCGRSFPA